eukprot:scpid105970/ scgid13278/ 
MKDSGGGAHVHVCSSMLTRIMSREIPGRGSSVLSGGSSRVIKMTDEQIALKLAPSQCDASAVGELGSKNAVAAWKGERVLFTASHMPSSDLAGLGIHKEMDEIILAPRLAKLATQHPIVMRKDAGPAAE